MKTKKIPVDIKIDLTDDIFSKIKRLKILPETDEKISFHYNKRTNELFRISDSISDLRCNCCLEKATYINYRPHYLHKISLKIRDDKFLTLDHVKPKSNGGRNSTNNYQILCNYCNGRKSSLEVNIFLLRLIFRFDLDKKYYKLKKIKNKISKIMRKKLWQLFFV